MNVPLAFLFILVFFIFIIALAFALGEPLDKNSITEPPPAPVPDPPKPEPPPPPPPPLPTLTIPYADRPMHVYIPGKTRFGKSTLIHHMALNDIQQGHGVCVMDGKGDFIPNFIRYIPEHRVLDTIYLDIDTPIPLDFMGFTGEREKETLIGELKYLLMNTMEPQYAPLMTANITDLLYALFSYNENPKTPDHCRATFLDIYYFLTDSKRRAVILAGVTDYSLLQRWKDNFPNPVEVSRITTRMTPYVRSETLRKLFGAKKAILNIDEVIQKKQILLVNLGPPSDIRRTYGILLLSKIRQAIYRRESFHPPYYLFCDEFQEFQTYDFDKILSLAGGMGLCLTLANQYVDQLEPHILHAIKGNVSTFVAFRLGQESANALKSEFPKVILSALDDCRARFTSKLERLHAQRELLVQSLVPELKTEEKASIHLQIQELDNQIIQFTEGVANLPPPPADASQLPFLSVGQAIYRAADGTASLLTTEKIPPPPDADYAQYIRKCTVDNYACNTSPVCSTDTDEHRTQPSDEIKPSGPPHIPPHGGKKKDA